MKISRRTFFAGLGTAAAISTSIVAHRAIAQMPQGVERGGVRIRNAEERRLFDEVLCMCGGCQRESLALCQCGYADDYRNEVRAMMAEGLSREAIHTEWVRRFGPQALSVPPNQGGNRLLYLGPLAAIIGMAAFVITLLRRFRRRGDEKAAVEAAAPVAAGGRDEYDEKLDEELKQLDDE